MSILLMCLITIAILQVSVLFTTIYLHRAQCHRGLDLHPIIGNLMHFELALFTGVTPREWVAVHRKHHHFSDREGDPHSPHLEGMWKVLFGNYFMYRKEVENQATIRKYTPDHKPDLIDKTRIGRWWLFGGLAIFMLMFGWSWGVAAWVFHMIAYVLLNSSINSLCHMVGYRNFDNLATNITVIAWMTGGEGYHNNHHEYPSSAKFGLRRMEFDPAWPVICLLERFGLAKVRPEPLAKAA